MREYHPNELATLLPMPAADVNKYTRGRLVVIAGSARYPGAACLAAAAGQRAGAGYTQVVCAPEAVDVVRAFRPSLVVRSWADFTSTDLPTSAANKPLAYVLGPGFDAQDAECARMFSLVLKYAQAPVLVDGGALAALATPEGHCLVKNRFLQGLSTVVTPHGGEAACLARLFELPTNNPAELARLISLAFGAVAVVKGPQTFVSNGEDAVISILAGTPALAKAGTGDVLAGIMGAFLAQALEPIDAAVLAATIHAEAGRYAANNLTDMCVIPEDVIDALPHVVSHITSESL